MFKKNKVEWVQGWGRYEGPGRVSVEKDGKKTDIEASNILMVSGSEARALAGNRTGPQDHFNQSLDSGTSVPFRRP